MRKFGLPGSPSPRTTVQRVAHERPVASSCAADRGVGGASARRRCGLRPACRGVGPCARRPSGGSGSCDRADPGAGCPARWERRPVRTGVGEPRSDRRRSASQRRAAGAANSSTKPTGRIARPSPGDRPLPGTGDLTPGLPAARPRPRHLRRAGRRAALDRRARPPARREVPLAGPREAEDRLRSSAGVRDRGQPAPGGHARLSPAGLRPVLPVGERRGWRHDGGRGRLQRSDRRVGSLHLPLVLRPARLHDVKQLLPEGRAERDFIVPGAERGLGAGDRPRPRRRVGDLPEMPHSARGGQLQQLLRSSGGHADRGQQGSGPDLGQLVGCLEQRAVGVRHLPGGRHRGGNRRRRLCRSGPSTATRPRFRA